MKLSVSVAVAKPLYDSSNNSVKHPVPTLLYWHGLGGCKQEAEGYIEALCAYGVAVAAVDMPVRNTPHATSGIIHVAATCHLHC